MQLSKFPSILGLIVFATCLSPLAHADENLFGYVKGAEPLPKGATELYGKITSRSDKGTGHYQAIDVATEIEYGATDKLAISGELIALGIDTYGIQIDGYLPSDNKYTLKFSGVEAALKYNFLSPALNDIGLSLYTSFSYVTLDRHSGQDKQSMSLEEKLLLQKYFLDGQLIVTGNIGVETERSVRGPIDNLPAGFDWSTEPEMEVALEIASGISYRFAPNWFAGIEAWYVQENETEVGLERWSVQAGPTMHYGGKKWWSTFTWLPQIQGGGEKYEGQTDDNLHLIEKTKQEYRLKIGYNF